MKIFKYVNTQDLKKDLEKYLGIVAKGETIYLIHKGIIVAKIEKVSFGGTIGEPKEDNFYTA